YMVGQISIKHPEEKVATVLDFRKSMLKSVYSTMLNARLSELAQSAHPPFLQASVGIDEFLGGLDAYTAFSVAKPNEFAGRFTATEFARAIVSIQKNNETAYSERDKKKSEHYVNRYLNFYLEDSPALSNEDLYQLYKQLLPTLTLGEVDAIGESFYIDTNRDVIIMAPDQEKENLPDQQQVDGWFEEVEREAVGVYEDKVSDLPLISKEPQAGKVAAEKNMDAIEAKEWTLSNSVKVILKPTTFKNDEILISAFSPGGTSLYSDSDYFSAAQAANLVNSSGVGQLN